MGKLRELFQAPARQGAKAGKPQTVQMAACVLLLEMEHADFNSDAAERETVRGQMLKHFDLDEETLDTLLASAQARERESVSMHQYLRTLNEFLEYKDKLVVVEMLWRVAYADGELDRHEEALLRRMSELLYVSPQDFVRVKLEVQEALGI
jgi:uncharacterized tellurite resistance protein B-like protein